MNKSARREALKAALSRRCEESALTVVDSFTLPEIKTTQVVDVLNRFEFNDMLLVLAESDDTVRRSARNIPHVHVLPVEGLNVYDILKFRNLVMTRDAVARVTARLGE
jgi:large subunit ribosomal protein L4